MDLLLRRLGVYEEMGYGAPWIFVALRTRIQIVFLLILLSYMKLCYKNNENKNLKSSKMDLCLVSGALPDTLNRRVWP